MELFDLEQTIRLTQLFVPLLSEFAHLVLNLPWCWRILLLGNDHSYPSRYISIQCAFASEEPQVAY